MFASTVCTVLAFCLSPLARAAAPGITSSEPLGLPEKIEIQEGLLYGLLEWDEQQVLVLPTGREVSIGWLLDVAEQTGGVWVDDEVFVRLEVHRRSMSLMDAPDATSFISCNCEPKINVCVGNANNCGEVDLMVEVDVCREFLECCCAPEPPDSSPGGEGSSGGGSSGGGSEGGGSDGGTSGEPPSEGYAS